MRPKANEGVRALVACMRKRLTTLDAMVRSNTPWDNSLHRT